jgi:hypothetical protein
MSGKPFTLIAVLVFAIVALVHVVRLFTHFQVIIGSHTIPMWASWAGLVLAGVMAVMVWRENSR